jgi:hypothetical protein
LAVIPFFSAASGPWSALRTAFQSRKLCSPLGRPLISTARPIVAFARKARDNAAT